MVLNALVEERLGDCGIVHFAVAVAAIADEVDDHVGTEFGAVFGGEAAYAHDGIGIFTIDVKDGHALAAGNAGSVTRRVFLRGARGEADQIVDNDVECAADGISREIGEIQRFRPNALPSEGGIAVHHDGPDFIQRFPRAIDLRAIHTVARQFCARAAHGDGIHGFEVAGVRDQVDIERFSGRCSVHAGSADVIFNVACAKHAAGINILKARDNLVHRFAGNVGHDVEPAAVAHGHDGINATDIAGGIEDGIEKRDERSVAFQRETLAAEIAALEHLFKEVGANQAVQDRGLVDLELGAFHALGNPAAALGFRDVEEFHADVPAIIAAGFLGEFAGETFEIGALQRGEKAERIEGGFIKTPATEKIKDTLALGVSDAIRRRRLFRGSSRSFWERTSHGWP